MWNSSSIRPGVQNGGVQPQLPPPPVPSTAPPPPPEVFAAGGAAKDAADKQSDSQDLQDLQAQFGDGTTLVSAGRQLVRSDTLELLSVGCEWIKVPVTS